MNTSFPVGTRRLRALGLALALAGAGACALALPDASTRVGALSAQALGAGGLEKQGRSPFDALYLKPGVQWAEYQGLHIAPIEVSFASHWQPKQPGSTFPMRTAEREALRLKVATLAQEQFQRVFQGEAGAAAPGRLALVKEPGPKVLNLRARLVDVWLAAPHSPEPGLVHTYARTAGEMTLVLELLDATTGQVLARVQDQRQGRDIGRMVRMDGIATIAEIEDMAAHWAREVRRQIEPSQVAAR